MLDLILLSGHSGWHELDPPTCIVQPTPGQPNLGNSLLEDKANT